MALIKCPECGKELSNRASSCPNCGCPINSNMNKRSSISYLRLVISIFLLVSSLFVIYQSFFAGVSNVLSASNNLDGTIGVSFALFEITFGTIGIATCRTKNLKFLMIISVIMALIGLLYALVYNGFYEDLNIWGWIMCFSGLIWAINAQFIFKKIKKSSPRGKSKFNDSLPGVDRSKNYDDTFLADGECIAYWAIVTMSWIFWILVFIMVLYRIFINPI